MVTGDHMYNGMYWSEEEFTRVTVERDLKISKFVDENPVIWKILAGLAESR